MGFSRLITIAFLGLAPMTAAAQAARDTVVLMADRLFMQGNNTLIAEGHVEAIQGDIRLEAKRILFDRRQQSIEITGPIRLSDGQDLVILAEFADLDMALQTGLLRSARMVLSQQVQLAAVEIARIDGRYSQLQKVAVTSCKVCSNGKPPLWQIRARRVVHDQEKRQLYFHDAHLMVGNTQVMVLPRLRLPDPSLKRAAGFMVPTIRSNTLLGTGIKLPYFIPIGSSRDLTLTPYLSSETTTLEFRYRQAFRNGDIEFNGALSDDTVVNTTRGYIFGTGAFDLARDFKLEFDLKATTDDAYLLAYDYSSLDRLDSEVSLSRKRRDESIGFEFHHFQSLRDSEDNATIPTLVVSADYEKRLFPSLIGGEFRLGLEAHSHYRYSDLDTDGSDTDSIVDGRDVARLGVNLEWLRNWTLIGGLRAGVTAQYSGDAVFTAQDASLASSEIQGTPAIAAELRLPLVKTDRSGASHVLEPVAMIGWAGGNARAVANDESTRVEFDEGNLLSLSRFPAADRRERGLTGAFGLSWSRMAPSGWSSNLTLGQVVRDTNMVDFSGSSGLSGRYSDVLVAGQLKMPNGFSITGRGLFDSGFDTSKAEARASWNNNTFGLDATYVWLGADTAEDRASTLSEWSLDGDYRVSRHWTWSTNWRYDVASDNVAAAGLGLEYQNECVKFDFSLSRRFTSSTTVQPSTDIGFTVSLLGFTMNSANKNYSRSCRNDAG